MEDCYQVVTDNIDLASLQQTFNNLHHGAVVSFVGKVREFNLGKKVTKIAYQVAQPLAINLFAQFAQQAREKWDKHADILIIHRSGELLVGEISIVILVSTEHRKESFLINQYLIEIIKAKAPIWKKEYYISGESGWVKGHALCQH